MKRLGWMRYKVRMDEARMVSGVLNTSTSGSIECLFAGLLAG